MSHEAMEVSNRGLASDGGQASCVAALKLCQAALRSVRTGAPAAV
jgi:hypothetical protein